MRTIIITGASGGLAQEMVKLLPEDRLILLGRNQEKLEDLYAGHPQAECIGLDITDSSTVQKLVEELIQRYGKIDVLVNNAGFGTGKDVVDDDPERLEQEVRLNCLAVVGLTARYLPAMRKRGNGTIINISSAAAFQPMPHMAVYGATKAFVLSFTEALWRETRRDGIRVLAVCPGSTDTPFFQVADEGTVVGRLRSTRQVLDTTMRALRGSGPSVVDGLGNAVVARFLTRVLPKRALLAAVDRVFRH